MKLIRFTVGGTPFWVNPAQVIAVWAVEHGTKFDFGGGFIAVVDEPPEVVVQRLADVEQK